MSLLRKRKYGVVLLVAVLMICAVCARVAARYGYYAEVLSIVRALIYIGLLAAWGISVQTRIIQTQVRRYLLVIAGLMLLWLTLRTVKYNTYHMTAERFLWYGYYLPMLFIPVLAVLVALSLGKPENYRLPKWTHFLYLPSLSSPNAVSPRAAAICGCRWCPSRWHLDTALRTSRASTGCGCWRATSRYPCA